MQPRLNGIPAHLREETALVEHTHVILWGPAWPSKVSHQAIWDSNLLELHPMKLLVSCVNEALVVSGVAPLVDHAVNEASHGMGGHAVCL
jgi:hypothetical protein